MENVYILEESIGMYSDEHSWPIKAYRSYEKAKSECDKLNKEMDEIQHSFDKLNDKDTDTESLINEVKEFIFQEARPDLFGKWYQMYHSEEDYSWDDETAEVEGEYYNITDEAEKNVEKFISTAKSLNKFSEEELSDIETYLTYLRYCYDGNIYDGLPSYYVSNNSIEIVD